MQYIREGQDIIPDIDPRKDTLVYNVMKFTKFNFTERFNMCVPSGNGRIMLPFNYFIDNIISRYNGEIPLNVKSKVAPYIGFSILHSCKDDETVSLIIDNFCDELTILCHDIISTLFEISDVNIDIMLEEIYRLWGEAKTANDLKNIENKYKEIMKDFYYSLYDLNREEPKVLNNLFYNSYAYLGYLLMRSSTLEIIHKQNRPDFFFEIDGKPAWGITTVIGQTFVFNKGIAIKK